MSQRAHVSVALGLGLGLGLGACGVRPGPARPGEEAVLQLEATLSAGEGDAAQLDARLDGRPLRGLALRGQVLSGRFAVEPGQHVLTLSAGAGEWAVQETRAVESCVGMPPDMCMPHQESSIQLERTSAGWHCERSVSFTVSADTRVEVHLRAGPDRCSCRAGSVVAEQRRELWCQAPAD